MKAGYTVPMTTMTKCLQDIHTIVDHNGKLLHCAEHKRIVKEGKMQRVHLLQVAQVEIYSNRSRSECSMRMQAGRASIHS